MATVAELRPGDLVTNASMAATYVAQAPHPIWPHLRLVIWRMADGSWSHDALDPQQYVGIAVAGTHDELQQRLRAALLEGLD